MLHADPLVGAERRDELLGGAVEPVLLLGHRPHADLDGEAARESDPFRIASRLAGPPPHVVEAGGQLPRGDPHEVGEPRVAVGRGPPLGAGAFTAHPEGDARRLKRLGVERQLVEAVVAPLEARPLLRPEPVHQPELLVGQVAALLEGDPQGLELLHHPADPHAEEQTAFREVVDRGGNLSPVEGMAIGHDEDAHPEPDLLGAAGQEGEAGQRLQEGAIGRDDEAPLRAVRIDGLDLPGDDDAVRRPDRIVAEGLRPARRLHQHGAGRAAGDRKEDPELHRLCCLAFSFRTRSS